MYSIGLVPPTPKGNSAMSPFDAAAASIFSPTRVSPVFKHFDMDTVSLPNLSYDHLSSTENSAANYFDPLNASKEDLSMSSCALIPKHSPLLSVRRTEKPKRVQPLKLFISSRYKRSHNNNSNNSKHLQQHGRQNAVDVKHPNALPSFQITLEGSLAAAMESSHDGGSCDKTPTPSPSRIDKTPIASPATARPYIPKQLPLAPEYLSVNA